jgi:hypothetical protein
VDSLLEPYFGAAGHDLEPVRAKFYAPPAFDDLKSVVSSFSVYLFYIYFHRKGNLALQLTVCTFICSSDLQEKFEEFLNDAGIDNEMCRFIARLNLVDKFIFWVMFYVYLQICTYQRTERVHAVLKRHAKFFQLRFVRVLNDCPTPQTHVSNVERKFVEKYIIITII